MSRETDAKASLEIAYAVIKSAQRVINNVRRELGTPAGANIVKHARALRKAASGKPLPPCSDSDDSVRYDLTEAGISALNSHRKSRQK